MAKTTTSKDPAPVGEAVFGNETVVPVGEAPEVIVETPSPEVVVVGHVAASESEGKVFTEPDPEALPLLPYVITELGIQPVALASRTFASDFGPGGAANVYKTIVYGADPNAVMSFNSIRFHGCSRDKSPGVHIKNDGISDSTLLSILADRWTAFQDGPFASEQTGKALACIHEAATWLNARTAEREARGVQGKHEA